MKIQKVPGFLLVLSLTAFLTVSLEAQAGGRFEHGVASGDPLTDAVILWTRVTPERSGRVRVAWEVSESEDFSAIVQNGELNTSSRWDYTVKVDVRGLKAGQTYFYRFRVGESMSPVGRTRTLPTGSVEKLTFAVVSCSNFPQGYFNVYRAITEHDEIDAVLHLGDYIYEYPRGAYSSDRAGAMDRESLPEGEVITLADYRIRHAQYKADPDSQEVHRLFPFIAVWDDHELANDAWHSGAENHDEGEGRWKKRRNAAVRAYQEWMPIRPARGRDAAGRIYRNFEMGDLASLVMLDTRLIGRDEQMSFDDRLGKDINSPEAARKFLDEELGAPARTLLGETQENWLAARLRDSKSRGVTWQIIGQQLIVAPTVVPDLEGLEIVAGKDTEATVLWIDELKKLRALGLPWNLDAWDGYPAARQRFLDTMQQHASNAVVLSGDTHNSWAYHLQNEDRTRVHGVELATPGVSSPGMESYLPVESDELLRRAYEALPHMAYANITDRGYLLLRVTPDELVAEWRYVSTVLSRDYTVRCEKALAVQATDGPGTGLLKEKPCE